MEPEKEVEQEKTLAEKLKDLLDKFDNRPSAEAINEMKSKHGDVYLSALSDDEICLFRSVTRKEHRAINSAIAEGKMAPDDFELEIVKSCVLWTSIGNLESKAGTIPSLFEQIMQNSNFLAPQLLTNLVTKL
jgi:hypothetical protein